MSEARISNRDLGVWIVQEKGDATAYPTAAESVGVRSDVSLSQPRQYVDSEERRPGLARRERLAALYDPGEWALETYLRPGGAAKKEPAETQLLECLLGRVESARRTYRPRAADSKIPKCRIYVRKGETLYIAHDAIVTEATLTLGAAGTDLAMGRWTAAPEAPRLPTPGLVRAVNHPTKTRWQDYYFTPISHARLSKYEVWANVKYIGLPPVSEEQTFEVSKTQKKGGDIWWAWHMDGSHAAKHVRIYEVDFRTRALSTDTARFRHSAWSATSRIRVPR